MPRLTVRAAAEMLKLSALEQLRILHEQKYPKQGPQPFRVPYYSPAVAAIRTYYASNNDPQVLVQAFNELQSIGQHSRRSNLARALKAFEGSVPSRRRLAPTKNYRTAASIGDLEIRSSPDLQALDSNEHKVLYVNCKQVALDADYAQRIAEVAQWVYEENGVQLPLESFEILDLAARKFLRFKRRRPATIRLLKQNAKVMEALWDAA